jgi:phage-related protein
VQDALKLLEEHAKKSNVGINDLFSSVEAGNAALALTGSGTEMFTNNLAEMANSMGATDAAFTQMEKGAGRSIAKIKATWAGLKLTLGERVMEWVAPMLERASELFGMLAQSIEMFDGDLVGGFADFLYKLGLNEAGDALIVIAGEVENLVQVISDGIPVALDWIKSAWNYLQENESVVVGIFAAIAAVVLAVVVPALATLIATMAPVILVMAAVGGAAYLLHKAWTSNWGGIRDTLTNFWNNTGQPIFETVKTWLITNLPVAIQTLTDFWNDVLLPALIGIWNFLTVDMMPIWLALAELLKVTVGKAIEVLTALWNDALLPAIKDVWAFIQDKLIPKIEAMTSSWGSAKDIIEKVAKFINDVSSAISNLNIAKLLQLLGIKSADAAAPAARAMGGPVTGDTPYMVGEKGPELFVPNRNGQIIPNGGTTNYTLIINEAGSRGDIASDFGLMKAIAGA